MGRHADTGVGTRCANCGLIYPADEAHACSNHTPPSTQWDTATPPSSSEPNSRDGGSVEEGPDLSGTVIGERYRIVKRLSAGGMGVVYQARHTLLNSLLAVKILLYAQDEEARGRFLREAQIASQIQHPNTVFISDFGVLPDGRPYLVMEFLKGPTLRQVLERGALDALRALKLAAQIARGLQTVHDKGIVHRGCQLQAVVDAKMDLRSARGISARALCTYVAIAPTDRFRNGENIDSGMSLQLQHEGVRIGSFL